MITLKPITKLPPVIAYSLTREGEVRAVAAVPVDYVQDIKRWFTTTTGALFVENPVQPGVFAQYPTVAAYNTRSTLPVYVQGATIPVHGRRAVSISFSTLNIEVI